MLFTKQELKMIKFKLMNKGLSKEQAHKEVEGMIETTRINHIKAVEEKKDTESSISFKDKFRELKEGKK